MTRKAEYRLAGLALLVALLCILGMNLSVQNVIISIFSPILTSTSGPFFIYGKYFTPNRMIEYFNRCAIVLLKLEIICILLYFVWRKTKDNCQILQGDLAPFVLLVVGGFLLHVFLILNWGDDMYFRNSLYWENSNFIHFLSVRYNQWSSRLIIETLLVFVSQVPILWWFLDTAILLLAAYSLGLLLPNMDRRANYLLVCLIFIYPFIDMRTAGWIATTMNYLWPLSFGLYSMVSIKRIFHGEPLKIHHYVLSVLALLYAANFEQMGAVLVGFFVFFSIYQVIIQKKLHWFLLVQAVLSIASIAFILTAPGNDIRAAWTIKTHFPGYLELSLFDKLEIGFSSSLFELLMKPNISFLFFGLLLYLAAKVTKQRLVFRLIAVFPLVVSLLFGVVGPLFGKLFPFVYAVRDAMTKTGTNPSFFNPMSLAPDILLMMVSGSIIVLLYRVFAVKKDAWLVLLVLSAGFASRVIMAFTSAIWFSEGRTFIYLYFALIYCSMRLFQVVRVQGTGGTEKIVISTATVLAVFSWLFHMIVGSVVHMLPMS